MGTPHPNSLIPLRGLAAACNGGRVDVRLYDDIGAFADVAGPLLHADPVRHTVAATVLAEYLTSSAPKDIAALLTVHDDGVVQGAALRVGRWPLITSALPPKTAPAVAEALSHPLQWPPGASGPKENARSFAAAWCRQTGVAARVAASQRLFELTDLRSPSRVPGRARVADSADIELLAQWHLQFALAADPEGWRHPESSTERVTRRMASGQGNLLWEVGGELVAMAAASPPIAAMSRVGPVWTPPEHRFRGYGSAVTAAATRWALDAGARHVVLFTDLANPVSNSIYPKIGYRPVYDAVELAFEPAQ